MAKLMNWNRFEKALKEKKFLLFSITDIHRLFGVTRVAATFLLHRYSKKGYIQRIKQGLYIFPDLPPPASFIANKIYSPSYLSREFALSYHGIIPETVYEMTSVSTKSTRSFEIKDRIYSYRSIKREAYTGYTTAEERGITFNIADPEKAFVDAIYFRLFDGLEPISRFNRKKINFESTLGYTKLFNNEKLSAIIEEVLSK